MLASDRFVKIECIAKIDISLNNGATTRLLDFCADLAKRHQVRVWLQRGRLPPVLTSTRGLEVRLLPAPTPESRADVLKGLRALGYEAALALQLAAAFSRGRRSDAIYLREVATLAPGLISKLFGVPLFLEIDGFPYRTAKQNRGILQSLRARALRWQARLCAGIVTFSDGQRLVMMEDYGVLEECILTIPNGADLERFNPQLRAEAIESLGLDPHQEYLVWAGSLRANQEIPVLMEAFAGVHARRPSARLLLLSPSVGELEQAARAARIQDAVLIRHVDHSLVPSYIAAASVCIATMVDTPRIRTNAVAPLKLFEYMACGRVAITAGLPFLGFVEREALGLLYQSGNAKSLAAAMFKLLSLPEAELAAMGMRANAYVQENHNWARLNARTEAFLGERMASRAGHDRRGSRYRSPATRPRM